jgi:hypothetical protein
MFGSCEPQLQDEIPYVLVEIDVNLNNTEFFDLSNDGGYVYILGGVRGIIIYRENENDYRAFERNSPIDAFAACSTIDVDASGLFMVDPCHNVFYDFEGLPISGNSLPLRQYETILDRNWLYIRSGSF